MSANKPDWMDENVYALLKQLPASSAPHLLPIVNCMTAQARDIAHRGRVMLADVLDAMANDWQNGSRRGVKGCVADVRALAKLCREVGP